MKTLGMVLAEHMIGITLNLIVRIVVVVVRRLSDRCLVISDSLIPCGRLRVSSRMGWFGGQGTL